MQKKVPLFFIVVTLIFICAYVFLRNNGNIPSANAEVLPGSNIPYITGFQASPSTNLFAEAGYSQPEIDQKLVTAWNSLFYGDPSNASVYFPVGDTMAFIKDTGNNDIRSEGMSYGMIIAAQLNKRPEFDKLWTFAKTYLKCPRSTQCTLGSGKEGYFSWQLDATSPFRARDEGPAPDGEEYMATALIIASRKWGNNGAINYGADAQEMLTAMLDSNRKNSQTAMFDPVKKVVVFAPIGNSAQQSNSSYHLPGFYELWAQFDTNPVQSQFWREAATASREYWKVASGYISGRMNGLMPDCTDLSGNPIYGCAGGATFQFDAWRTISNVATDWNWWKKDAWAQTEATNLQTFFAPLRPTYINRYNLDGTPIGADRNSPGVIAMNAVASLASTHPQRLDFVRDLWNLNPPTGQYRYYDGMLYLMGMLHVAGQFSLPVSSGGLAQASPAVPSVTSFVFPTDSIAVSITAGPTVFGSPSSGPSVRATPTATPIPTNTLSPTNTPVPTSTPSQAQAGSKTYYISDMQWTGGTRNGYGPVEKDKSNGGNNPGDGKALTLQGKRYAKGLGVHAYSSINIQLSGKCSYFQSQLGIDDEVGNKGSVKFIVYVDGRNAYQSPVMTGKTSTKKVKVPVFGAQYLELRVEDASNGNSYDHADWADAKVLCAF